MIRRVDRTRPELGDDRAQDRGAPDGQEAAKAMDQRLPPARGERRRSAAEEPGSRLDREGMNDEERVHPAPVSRPDQEIAARRQVLLARGLDPEPEDAEQDEPGEKADEAIQDRCPAFRRSTEPGEA